MANKSKTKRSTDELINSAIAQQNNWKENRRTFARRFLKTLNIFARPAPKPENESANVSANAEKKNVRKNTLAAYWFPILCAVAVILIAVWVMFVRTTTPARIVIEDAPVSAITVKNVPGPIDVPTFDIVRIDNDGMVVIGGRWMANKTVSIKINGKIVATESTDENGEFVYAPSHAFTPGNYTISLIGCCPEKKSENNVFLYVSAKGFEHSVSLLMTENGSTLMQVPNTLADGDLVVSKIDYLDTGRIVVTGDALPRLRVSLALDDKYLGFARVSDYNHFGLGADVGELEPGRNYVLTIRLHDGDGRTVAQVGHSFVMPEMTGDDDTFYTVRRGDCLWIIARNFLRRGVLFSIIAERNNIENPDLIFPNQKFSIPVDGGK